MKKLKVNLWVSGVVSLLFFMGCNDQDDMREGHAKLNVSLIDAPADYDEVWVEVLSVEILPDKENENNESAWISISNEADDKKLNLLTLTGGNSAFIGSKEVSAGKISQIRLVLGNDNYIIQEGERIDLTTPSAQQSGLKLQVNKELLPGIQYDLVIDFDAAQSIVRAGASGMFILKPVLRVVAEESASIKGKIIPEEAGTVVWAIKDLDTLATHSNDNGEFLVKGLQTGSYRVEIHPKSPYLGDTLFNVATQKGEVTILDPIILEIEE